MSCPSSTSPYSSSPPSASPRRPSWAAGPPGTDTPPTCEVPHFAPLRVRGGAPRLRRLARCRRRAMAAGLAVTAAALLVTGAGPGEADRVRGHPVADPVPGRPAPVGTVTAPVRIADGATARLLRPGDRVDVIAAEESATGAGTARVVARGARVSKVPSADEAAESGALVVLTVPRRTATRLAGAGATSRLAVTVW
ncbi:hypothetical protein [Streptomyces griseiscabiei]|uniref:Flp pilus assembly protein RcpC/CpaB domain-containing protein n=2 Tax=Streptomyces griseiscabiei TaxID=2993540 RepID=A0ABU4LI26_9ACTN|nr:hypothetical protein [Streptomyces griseiscabiei]MDX2914925.1 hypothetical protein [Streptomyces griseiscabiei]